MEECHYIYESSFMGGKGWFSWTSSSKAAHNLGGASKDPWFMSKRTLPHESVWLQNTDLVVLHPHMVGYCVITVLWQLVT